MKKLLFLAVLAGVIVVAAKLFAAEKAKWQGLSEAEVRERFDRRLPNRMPDHKRAEVADKAVAKMRERGVLREDDEAATEDEPGVADAVEETEEQIEAG